MPPLGARSKPQGLGRHRHYDLRPEDPVASVSREPDNPDLIKVAETYALLAVAEGLQFSLGQDWPAGPPLTQVPPRSIGRPTVSTSRSDSSKFAYAEFGTAPVATQYRAEEQARCRRKHDVEDVAV